ncbi:MAG: hypothetical protein UT53_C0007G0010 [Candidatus Yanofskybacteria bacterium GW2011_GWD2_39_48]|uniref:Uncharacterized protein n=1 Tax=Candidatus Yanofskybacteria bacterium GW2011_GWD2_39_48 TaxID=1619031 RepID=A0A0G0SDQ6_9BACT|nr:MAG: hypothetical protein UT53_C0007G0010 [Candidatus Yanofskybacteria bacterium GW2011_GWD2_39_48]
MDIDNKQASSYKPPRGLLGSIITRIKLEQGLKSIREIIVNSELLSIITGMILISLIFLVIKEITESGLFLFIALVLHEPTLFSMYARDVSFSILESVPGLSLILSLVFLGILLLIIRVIVVYHDKLLETKNKINKLLKFNK